MAGLLSGIHLKSSSLKLQFIGATGTVTGSKYLLTQGKRNWLVDCGLFQGLKVLRQRNWNPLPVKAKSIEAVVLTHAHIDHTGYLPLLVKNGFRGRVFATRATKSLCGILLPDSGHLQEEDASFINRHGLSKHHPALPLYTENDAREALEYIEGIPWGRKMDLGRHLSFRFLSAGHILGAAMVQVNFNGKNLLFSGDLGRPRDLIMGPPAVPEAVDYLVVESTYGDRKHPTENPEEILKELIHRTIGRGGTVLVPAFAVGRAQDVLCLIARLKKKGQIPSVPIYLNSPMAVNATKVFTEFPGEHTLSPEETAGLAGVAKFVMTMEESKKLNTLREPSIIISASGMMTGGRVLHHLKSLAPDPKNLILFVGFQAAGTRGEAMLHGVEKIKIHGEEVPVRAEVRMIDTLSAHADADEILGWLRKFPNAPKMTYITHGEPSSSEMLRKRIEEELHWACKVPDYLETVELVS